MKKAVEKVIHGSQEDTLYVDDKNRICATCQTPKSIRHFYYRRSGEVTVDCRECCDGKRDARQKEREQQQDERRWQKLRTS